MESTNHSIWPQLQPEFDLSGFGEKGGNQKAAPYLANTPAYQHPNANYTLAYPIYKPKPHPLHHQLSESQSGGLIKSDSE